MMFAGAHTVTNKIVHSNTQKEINDTQNDEKTVQNLANRSLVVPRVRPAMVVESRTEKVKRKALVQERKQERLVEQQKLIQHMEDLMEKVLQETPLSRKDEEKLRDQMRDIVAKVNKEAEKLQSSGRTTQVDPTPENQRAFVLWHGGNIK